MKIRTPILIRRRRGGVLVSTLVFVAITSLVLAGIGALTVSHYSRARVESDYAAAYNLAEAGINYELHNISQNMNSNPDLIDQAYPASGQNGPYTGSIPTISGSFTVEVIPEDSSGNPATSGSWTPPSPAFIQATGTVNGVTRTLRIEGKRHSLFGAFALFGIDSVTWNGSLIVNGDFGADTGVTVKGSKGEVYGEVIFNGANTTFPTGQATGGYTDEPDKVIWPTVSTLADYYATKEANKLGMTPPVTGGGLAWLRNTYNDNSRIQMFDPADATVSDPTQPVRISAGLTADANGNWEISDGMGSKTFATVNADLNLMDNPGSTMTRYVFPATTYTFTDPNDKVSVAAYGTYGNKVLILPGSPDPAVPYNYYLDWIDLTNGNGSAILIDNASGPINLWIGNLSAEDAAKSDNLNGTFTFTSSDSTKFRLYDAKTYTAPNSGGLNIGGNSVFNGSIYAYNGPNTGEIAFQGNPVINGSVIADQFNLGGNPLLNFPNKADGNSDYGAWFGFKGQYVEIGGMN